VSQVFCEGAYGRNSEQGETKKVSQVAWQVLKVALLFPILGKVLPRDLSPLKPVLVEGAWNRVRYSKGSAPLEAGGDVPMRDFEISLKQMYVVNRHLENLLKLIEANIISTTFNLYAEHTDYTYDINTLRNSYRLLFLEIPTSLLSSYTTLTFDKHTRLVTTPEYYTPYLFRQVYNFNWTLNKIIYKIVYQDVITNTTQEHTLAELNINSSLDYIYLPILAHRILLNIDMIPVFYVNSLLQQNFLRFRLPKTNALIVDLVVDYEQNSSLFARMMSNRFLNVEVYSYAINLSKAKLISDFNMLRNRYILPIESTNELITINRSGITYTIFDITGFLYNEDENLIVDIIINNKVNRPLLYPIAIIKPILKIVENDNQVLAPNFYFESILTTFGNQKIKVYPATIQTIHLS
jgi:hypothetical protein